MSFTRVYGIAPSMIFTEDERRALKEATIGVIGVGGTGGIASEQLVRSGVGAI